MKWLKRWRYYALIVILCGFVFGGWYFTSQSLKIAYPQAWADWKGKLQTAVNDYRNANNGSLPVIGSGAVTIIGGEQQSLIDICTLVASGLIPYPPDNCIMISGINNDNCDGGNCSCYNNAHYVWTVDSNGNVHSACIGGKCRTNNADGYQGIWP